MSTESRLQTYLLSVTILPQPGRQILRQTIHAIKDVLDKAAPNAQILHKFKVSGEARVLTIVDVSDNKGLENLVEAVWNLGSLDISSSPILHYDIFARNLGVAEELVNQPVPKLDKDHLYWIECDMEYPGKTLEEFLAIWKSEAEAVFTFRATGAAAIIPFKSLGQRKVNAFVNQPVPGLMDKMTFEVPVALANGNNVHMRIKGIQLLDEYTKENTL